MSWRFSLGRSILRYLAAFFLAQVVLLVAVFAAYRIQWYRLWAPLAVIAACHAGLAAFLLWRRPDFKVEGAESPLEKVNPPNALTIGRISSIPSILFLVLLARDYPVLPVALPFLCLVFATDLADGILARRGGGITFVGRYLDSSSDYLLIIAVSILYLLEGLIPAWFFWLLMARLVLFAAGMAWATLRQGAVKPVVTFLGKASIFAVMVLYAMEAAERFGVPWVGDPRVVRIFEYIVAGVVVVSLADKAVFLRRLLGRSV
ncbi:MAG: CDP-alcohol phosphatidyltransferase family protein [Spirochaetes bacterium]|nr:CDP-alcohol phosphatidyltransferase family protein [Spirochaetota bacterium]